MVFLMSTCLLCHLMLAFFLADCKMKWHIYIYIILVYAWQFPSLDQWKPNPLKSLYDAENYFRWLNEMTLFKVTHLKLPIVIWLWKWILIINNMLWQLSAICSQTGEVFVSEWSTHITLQMTDFSWKCTLQSQPDLDLGDKWQYIL